MAKRATMQNQVAFSDNSRLARNKTPAPRVTKRIREAIDVMVERGLDYQHAAAEAGLTTRHLRFQLSKPHVAAYYREQCQVSRASTTARNILRLCEIRDAENNMPAVNAVRLLEQISDEQTNKPNSASPGVTIRILNIAAQPQHEQSNKLANSTTNLDNVLITNDADLSTKQIADD
jgi:hypothetical protein